MPFGRPQYKIWDSGQYLMQMYLHGMWILWSFIILTFHILGIVHLILCVRDTKVKSKMNPNPNQYGNQTRCTFYLVLEWKQGEGLQEQRASSHSILRACCALLLGSVGPRSLLCVTSRVCLHPIVLKVSANTASWFPKTSDLQSGLRVVKKVVNT